MIAAVLAEEDIMLMKLIALREGEKLVGLERIVEKDNGDDEESEEEEG